MICYRSTDKKSIKPTYTGKYKIVIDKCIHDNGTRVMKFAPSLTQIYGAMFKNCTTLKSITIPESIDAVTGNPFSFCINLINIAGKFSSEDGLCMIVNNELKSYAHGSILTEYEIPAGVTRIGSLAFFNCQRLKYINIPETVTCIGIESFNQCAGLRSIELPEHLNCIEEWAFANCQNLKKIIIPDEVKGIHNATFIACYNLEEVHLGAKVEFISRKAFSLCESLKNIVVGKGMKTISSDAFDGCRSLESVRIEAVSPCRIIGTRSLFEISNPDFKIYVPKESVDLYRTSDGWNRLAQFIVPSN